jgi:multidrug resistance efflux pump
MEAQTRHQSDQHAADTASMEALSARLLRPFLGRDGFAANASTFLTLLVAEFGCERACLGFVDGDRLRIAALSDHPHPIAQAALPEVAAAMGEALMQQTTLCYPPADGPSQVLVAQAELARQRNVRGIACVPLPRHGELIGALVLESRERPFGVHEVAALEQLAAALGAWLELRYQQEQPLTRRLARAMRSGLARWSQRYPRRLRLVAGGSAALVAAILFALPLPSHVTATARLEASVQRVMTVPLDGYLKQIYVRPGDVVKAAQPLAELEDEALRTSRRRLESEAAQRENALADAVVRNDRVQTAASRAKLDEILAQLQLIDHDLTRAKLTAPFDGVVIQGDMASLLGAPLKRGEALLTLSQGKGFRIIVNIDERDVPELSFPQSGKLTLAAYPNQRFDIRVLRLTPVASAADGLNTFEAEAEFTAGVPPQLAPGLKGVAKIDDGAQPIGWRWAKRLWQRLSFMLWSWWG